MGFVLRFRTKGSRTTTINIELSSKSRVIVFIRSLQIAFVLPTVRRRVVARPLLLANIVRIRIVGVARLFVVALLFVVFVGVLIIIVIIGIAVATVLSVCVGLAAFRLIAGGCAAAIARFGLSVQKRFAAQRHGGRSQHFGAAFATCVCGFV